jgi:hypothetical protein
VFQSFSLSPKKKRALYLSVYAEKQVCADPETVETRKS